MAKKKDLRKTLKVSEEVRSSLNTICTCSKLNQEDILKRILVPLAQLAVSFEDFGFLCDPNGNQILITGYGRRSRIISGKMVLPNMSNIDEKKLARDIEQKLAKKKTVQVDKCANCGSTENLLFNEKTTKCLCSKCLEKGVL